MVRITAKPFVAGAFAMLLGSTMLSTSALADKQIFADLEDDGSVTTLFQADDGHIWAIFISADGKTFTVYDPGESNPNDDTTGSGSHSDKPDVVGLLKSGAATYKVKIAPADSPALMAHLQGAMADGGLAPRYNPSDDDSGNGPGAAPDHSMEVKKTDAEIRAEIAAANAIARELANLGSSMGDGDEGSGEGPAGFNKSGSGNPGDDDGNYTEGQNKNVGKTETDLLGPKPEYVNPPHWGNDLGSHGGDHTATGGGSKTGGGSVGGSAHTSMGGVHG